MDAPNAMAMRLPVPVAKSEIENSGVTIVLVKVTYRRVTPDAMSTVQYSLSLSSVLACTGLISVQSDT